MACSRAAGEQHLDARVVALGNKLLVEANEYDFPVRLLAESIEPASKLPWRERYATILSEVLDQVERQWTKPTGARRWLQAIVVWMANNLPMYALFASLILLLWWWFGERLAPALGQALIPVIVVLLVLIVLHILISLIMPMRWPTMRGEFQRQLERRLREELAGVYVPLPVQTAEMLLREREATMKLVDETKEIADWLEQREQAARIAGLYGSK
jgi:hypothetical protein